MLKVRHRILKRKFFRKKAGEIKINNLKRKFNKLNSKLNNLIWNKNLKVGKIVSRKNNNLILIKIKFNKVGVVLIKFSNQNLY